MIHHYNTKLTNLWETAVSLFAFFCIATGESMSRRGCLPLADSVPRVFYMVEGLQLKTICTSYWNLCRLLCLKKLGANGLVCRFFCIFAGRPRAFCCDESFSGFRVCLGAMVSMDQPQSSKGREWKRRICGRALRS